MKSVAITQTVTFTCDYLVKQDTQYSIQPCFYRVDVAVASASFDAGRILEFSALRQLIESVVPNMRFIVSTIDRRSCTLGDQLSDLGIALAYVSFEVCAENLCAWIAEMVQGRLYLEYPNIFVTEVILHENETSTARWLRSA